MNESDILKLMIDAMIELKRFYLNAIDQKRSYNDYKNGLSCPLCDATKIINGTNIFKCSLCPWIEIRGYTCVDKDEDCLSRVRYEPSAMMERVGELDNWILIYKGKLSCLS